jgi:pilus assembly protein CpaB
VPGEPVLNTPDRLATGEGAAARPAAAIPRDRVALTIPANEAVSVAGSVHPGDRVDVIATMQQPSAPPVTQAIFQDVRVFAVGPWQSDVRERVQSAVGVGNATSSITLVLDHQQAIALQHLLQTGGHVSLALRRFDQAGDLDIESITSDRLVRRYFGVGEELVRAARPTPRPDQ